MDYITLGPRRSPPKVWACLSAWSVSWADPLKPRLWRGSWTVALFPIPLLGSSVLVEWMTWIIWWCWPLKTASWVALLSMALPAIADSQIAPKMIIPMTLKAPRNPLILRRQKDRFACYDHIIFVNVPEFQKQLLNNCLAPHMSLVKTLHQGLSSWLLEIITYQETPTWIMSSKEQWNYTLPLNELMADG